MTPTETLLALRKRHSSLMEKRAVLVAREEQKRAEREVLRVELLREGVDPENVDGEIGRLQGELSQFIRGQESRLQAFEAEMKALGVTLP